MIYVEPVAAELWEQKLRRAREAYESVAAEFPNTEAAPVARFYSIRISYRLKEWDKAENDIDAFIKQGKRSGRLHRARDGDPVSDLSGARRAGESCRVFPGSDRSGSGTMKRIKDIALVVVILLSRYSRAKSITASSPHRVTSRPFFERARARIQTGPSARYILPQKEQTSRGKYYVNKLGYRGHDFSVEKQPGTIRVITMGGSSVFDVSALDDEDWPHRVEQLLKERGLSNVEVINAGIIGYNSADSLGRFIAEAHTFKPDYVFFSAWNDLKYFKSAQNCYGGRRSSRSRRCCITRVASIGFCARRRRFMRTCGRNITRGRVRREPAVSEEFAHTDEVNFEHLKQYRLNLELFVQAVRDVGAVPILMTEPTLVSRDNTDFEKQRIKYQSVELNHEQLCDAYQRVESIVREIAPRSRWISSMPRRS